MAFKAPKAEGGAGWSGWSSLPRGCRGDLVLVVEVGVDNADWVRVIHPVHGLRDILGGDLVPVQPDR